MVPAAVVLHDTTGAQSEAPLTSCFLFNVHPPHGKGSHVFEGASLATRRQAAHGDGEGSKVPFCPFYIDTQTFTSLNCSQVAMSVTQNLPLETTAGCNT